MPSKEERETPLSEAHARFHDQPGNLIGRDECGWTGCEFWDAASLGYEVRDAEVQQLREEIDELVECPLGIHVRHEATPNGKCPWCEWETVALEAEQLREERDAAVNEMHSRELHHFESEQKLEEAEADRDRYAAVIAAALAVAEVVGNDYDDSEELRAKAHSILASIDSGSALAERDAASKAEGWDVAMLNLLRIQGVDYRKGIANPYRAEQIRKEGQ